MKLSVLHERLVYFISALVFLSGLGWIVAHYFFAVDSEFGGSVSPSEPWWLSLHGAAAMATLIMIGSVLPGHVSRAWSLKKNRSSGLAMLSVAGVLIATGYGLYYAGNEILRPIISIGHWAVGLIAAPMLFAHVQLGKRSPPPKNSDQFARGEPTAEIS